MCLLNVAYHFYPFCSTLTDSNVAYKTFSLYTTCISLLIGVPYCFSHVHLLLTKMAMIYITTGLSLIDVYLPIIFNNYCAIMGSYSFCRKEDQLTFLVLAVGFVHTQCVLFFFKYYNGYIIMWPVWQYCVFLLEKENTLRFRHSVGIAAAIENNCK